MKIDVIRTTVSPLRYAAFENVGKIVEGVIDPDSKPPRMEAVYFYSENGDRGPGIPCIDASIANFRYRFYQLDVWTDITKMNRWILRYAPYEYNSALMTMQDIILKILGDTSRYKVNVWYNGENIGLNHEMTEHRALKRFEEAHKIYPDLDIGIEMIQMR